MFTTERNSHAHDEPILERFANGRACDFTKDPKRTKENSTRAINLGRSSLSRRPLMRAISLYAWACIALIAIAGSSAALESAEAHAVSTIAKAFPSLLTLPELTHRSESGLTERAHAWTTDPRYWCGSDTSSRPYAATCSNGKVHSIAMCVSPLFATYFPHFHIYETSFTNFHSLI